MKYRAEIDGLRAIAVVPVVLFHAGFDLFSGGFVGVDVFFVISGYLITAILIENIVQGNFSLWTFYERRARRILPSLFFVMSCTLPFAWLWMLPAQLKDFSQSLIATSTFVSNILFWQEDNYFAPAAEQKPLLHTWSLSVEEQYYVFFPVFLFLMWRFGQQRTFWVIFFLAVCSLILSEWSLRHAPVANFYLAPMRAWELLVGSIASFVLHKRKVPPNKFLSVFGLLCIIIPVFYYTQTTPFPGFYALIPVAGTLMVIIFATRETYIAKLLGNKSLVGIGLVSYSLYLWHQPLFAFARIRSLYEPTPLLMGTLSIIALVMAIITWRFVEQPFRQGKNKSSVVESQRAVFILSAIGLLFFAGLGIWGHLARGFPDRISPEVNHILLAKDYNFTDNCHYSQANPHVIPQESCWHTVENPQQKILVFGDSHSRSIAPAIIKILTEKKDPIDIYATSYSGCIPLRGLKRYNTDSKYDCTAYAADIMDFAATADIDTIVLTARFPLYHLGNRFDNHEGGVESGTPVVVDADTISGSTWNDPERQARVLAIYEEQFKRMARDFNVILIAPTPEAGWNVPDLLAKKHLFNTENPDANVSTSYDLYIERTAPVLELFNRLDKAYDTITYVPIFKELCNEATRRCMNYEDGNILYYDDDHLSRTGALKVVPMVRNAILSFNEE